jgi:hypothetical protein
MGRPMARHLAAGHTEVVRPIEKSAGVEIRDRSKG